MPNEEEHETDGPDIINTVFIFILMTGSIIHNLYEVQRVSLGIISFIYKAGKNNA